MYKYGLILIASVFCTMAQAMPEDKNQLANLAADTADLNQQKHLGVYEGNVSFDQGTTHLRAHKAVTEGNEKNQLTLAIAYGNTEAVAHFWTQTALDKPLLHAYADTIKYYPEQHLIELIGHARVIQGDDSFSAPKIKYQTEEQHIISESNAEERTVIIMHPKAKS